jgi:SAM-dependent methyltransferase
MAGFNSRPGAQDAGALLRAGRADEAARLYQQAIEANPRRPDAHNNLAVALKAAGRVGQAIESYRRAIKLDPGYVTARRNLARALRQAGAHEEALSHLRMLSRGSTGDPAARAEIVETLSEMTFTKPSAIARKILLELFQRRDLDLQRLALPTLRLLMTNRRLAGAVEAALAAYPCGEPARDPTSRELADPLLLALLTWTIPPSRRIEAWITMARRKLLRAVISGRPVAGDRALPWALAAHCHATEHAAALGAGERGAAEELAKTARPDEETKIAVAGMYLSLDQVPAARALWERISTGETRETPMRLVLERAIGHPATERGIAGALRRLTAIENETSRSVRAQYEENPYPKWLSVDREDQPRTLGERLGTRYPTLSTAGLGLEAPRILVAGCGTGRHAIATAARYRDCSVLAIDISQASLAYAARQARAFDQTNITFARADILALGHLGERFDLIECSGVLHHMADPMAGWRVLRGLTKPRGLMRIGLYSVRARKRWEALRAPVPEGLKGGGVAEFLRERRAALLAAPPAGPEALIFRTADFYSLSGCRDLLFHSAEVQLTLPEIAVALEDLELDFLGFDALPTETTRAFLERNKQPDAERDLAAWDAFEADNPDTFIAMYQFWCQARG